MRKRNNLILLKLRRKLLRHSKLLRTLLLFFAAFCFMILIFGVSKKVINSPIKTYYFFVRDFLIPPSDIVNSVGGITNILLLGKGDGGHEAPELTDTIMLASINRQKREVNLISAPRDIWITELRAKLNSVYYWGNKKEVGGGLILSKSVVESILDSPVQYAAVIDFAGFKKLINAVGGIEVDVQSAFTDEKYPIAGKEEDLCGGDPEYKCRYEILRFTQGKQFMNGETALKFVRSRNAEGDQGTDLARASRQQKVIEAIKEKLMSKEILISPKKVNELRNVLTESIETDISDESIATLLGILFKSRNNLKSYVVPEGLLMVPPKSPEYDNLYVFVPKSGEWNKIQDWVKCVLDEMSCD